jgi:hypothetical protein
MTISHIVVTKCPRRESPELRTGGRCARGAQRRGRQGHAWTRPGTGPGIHAVKQARMSRYRMRRIATTIAIVLDLPASLFLADRLEGGRIPPCTFQKKGHTIIMVRRGPSVGRPKLPRGEKRSHLLSVKMNAAEWKMLDRVCGAMGTGVTPSVCVRLLIEAEAERRGVKE